MKIFTEKGIVNKLLLILIAIVVLNTIIPTNVSYAAESDVGGVLLKPITDFMIAFGDFVMDLLHNVFYGMDTSILRVDKDNGIWEFLHIAIAVIAAAALIAVASYALVSAGLAIVSALSAGTVTGGISAAIGTIIVTSIVGGAAAGIFVRSEHFADEYVLPLYKITPEEIFTGKIRLLNVNFFNEPELSAEDIDTTVSIQNSSTVANRSFSYDTNAPLVTDSPDDIKNQVNQLLDSNGYSGEDIDIWNSITKRWSHNETAYEARLDVSSPIIDPSTGSNRTNWTFTISKGEWVGSETNTLGMELRPTIVKWYYTIRNFALIAMMIILLYIGIRIMLCGVSSEKAKYKNMLMDWVIAVCLIFIMHYIMAFSMNIVDGFIEIFGAVNNDQEYIVNYEYEQKIVDGLNEIGVDTTSIIGTDGSGNRIIIWDAKNIVGLARVNAALNNSGTYVYIGWGMCYLVLVFYTVFFIYTYLRRALYIAFFTVIAPFVAMTYPLDKLHDGKAQAFDMWMKEYIFNLMIQPVHLLLYTVLISSAFNLAATNIVYMLVAIGFMMPAEKFLRKMFGFDKAQTPGVLDGAAGTALMVTGLNKILNKKHSKNGNGNNHDKSGDDDKSPVRKKLGDTTEFAKNPGNNIPEVSTYTGGGSSGNNSSSDSGSSSRQRVNPVLLNSNGGARRAAANRRRRISGSSATTNNSTPIRVMPVKRRVATTPKTTNIPKPPSTSGAPTQKQPRKIKLKSGSNVLPGGRKITVNTPTQQPSQQPSKFKRVLRGIGAAANEFKNEKLGQFSDYLSSGDIIDDISSTTRGVIGGAWGATLGTAATIMSGQGATKLPTYAGGLGVAGYSLASKDINVDYDEDAITEEYERAQYDSNREYKEAQRQKETEKVIENEKNLRKVRKYLGDDYGIDSLEDAKEFMQKHQAFIDAGYDNMLDFCTLAKMVEDGHMDQGLAAKTMDFYKKGGGKPSSMGQKEKENIEFILRNTAVKAGVTDETQIQNSVRSMLDKMELCADIRDNFTKIK